MADGADLRSVLGDTGITRLVGLVDEILPGVGDHLVAYLDRRLVAGKLDLGHLFDGPLAGLPEVLEGSDPAATRVDVWSRAEPGTREARWFETLRAWAWEAHLCDPRWGGNPDGRGWARFEYVGHPKAGRGDGA